MNPFKNFAEGIPQETANHEVEMLNHEAEMFDMHRKLVRATGLSCEEMRIIERADKEFVCGDYLISCRSFCLSNGWFDLMFAVPASMETCNIGYSNIQVGEHDDTLWYYKPGGTGTIIHPIGDEIDNVLEAVKNMT